MGLLCLEKEKAKEESNSLLLLKMGEYTARLFLRSAEQSTDRESCSISILGYFQNSAGWGPVLRKLP